MGEVRKKESLESGKMYTSALKPVTIYILYMFEVKIAEATYISRCHESPNSHPACTTNFEPQFRNFKIPLPLLLIII